MDKQGTDGQSHLDMYQASLDAFVRQRIQSIREILEHSGEKGVRVEKVVEDLIRDFLPARFSLRSGFLMDHLGHLSRQTDLIITDELTHPRLFNTVLPVLHPADSAVATIEVKTTLDGNGLAEAIDNITTTRKNLSLIHGGGKWLICQGQAYVETSKHVTPEPVAVILGYESTKLDSLIENITELYEGVENKLRFDLLYVLDSGLIVGWQPSGTRDSLFYRPADDRDNRITYEPASAHLEIPQAQDKGNGVQSDTKNGSRTSLSIPVVRAFFYFMLVLHKFMSSILLPSLDALLTYYAAPAYFRMQLWPDKRRR